LGTPKTLKHIPDNTAGVAGAYGIVNLSKQARKMGIAPIRIALLYVILREGRQMPSFELFRCQSRYVNRLKLDLLHNFRELDGKKACIFGWLKNSIIFST
jgi:hypothetical protein